MMERTLISFAVLLKPVETLGKFLDFLHIMLNTAEIEMVFQQFFAMVCAG